MAIRGSDSALMTFAAVADDFSSCHMNNSKQKVVTSRAPLCESAQVDERRTGHCSIHEEDQALGNLKQEVEGAEQTRFG